MSRGRAFVAGFGLAVSIGCASTAMAGPVPARPNVVFILADDLGWRDTSLYGSTFYRTPNLERLASRGMLFTQAYAAAPICSPSRASILTGLWPGRVGITSPVCHQPEEYLEELIEPRALPNVKALSARSATRLKVEYPTLAKSLKQAGYVTGHFGKWHLGPEPYSPLQQGFDLDVPHYAGPGPAGCYIAPWKFPPQLKFQGQPGEDIEDRMASEAVNFLRANKDRPFFLNYWAFSVHSPWDAKPELIEKYRKLADPKAPQRNALYAAMIENLDDSVGTLMRTLAELGLTERTIVVFFSDNGGVHWDPSAEGPGSVRLHPDFAGVPITSNAPLRGGKGTIYEGGTREPCVVVWPGVTKPGAKSDAIVQSVDFYPSLLEMVGLKPHDGQKFDGISFAPALRGQPLAREAIFCIFPHYAKRTGAVPSAYVRAGDWKLVRDFCDNDDQSDRFELYNLKDDLGETLDLAGKMPEKVRELNRLLDGFLADSKTIVPKPNPNYRRPPPGARLSNDWIASLSATAFIQNGQLAITVTGTNPSIVARDVPAGTGPFTFEWRMKSNSKGNGRLFWAANPRQPFFRDRAVPVVPQPDNQWHDYAVKLPVTTPIGLLRLDPGMGPGEIRIEYLRLRDRDGAVVKEWRFENAP